jgi:GR25 family glycosyltransferase involved in LPS biosynthesis
MINKINKILIIIVLILLVILVITLALVNNKGKLDIHEGFTSKKNFNWNGINGICYINLENRSDRKNVLLNELAKLDIPEKLIHRIEAVYTPGNGHKGCVQSHIKAIEYAKKKGWKYFLILEDDFELLVTPDEFKTHIKSIINTIKQNDKWDVILLATNSEMRNDTIFSNELDSVKNSTTSSAYILNSNYINTLLSCFKYCDQHLSDKGTTETNHEPYALDQQWKKLQENDRWFAPKVKLSKQSDIWSSTMFNINNSFANTHDNTHDNIDQFINTLDTPNVLYINLDNRTDRNKQLLSELTKLEIPESKIHRISAVYMPKNGHKGCVQSHIKALNLVRKNKWPYALILEDDFELAVTPTEFRSQMMDMITTLLKNKQDWDVIMLATAYSTKEPLAYSDNIVRIKKATTSSAYVINYDYIDTLLKCFYKCDDNMSEDKIKDPVNGMEEYALDQQWGKLQAIDRWFGFKKDPSKQREVWSSIQTNIHNNINNKKSIHETLDI